MTGALVGVMGAAGAGKSTVAAGLVDRWGFRRVRLADGIKRMLRALDVGDEHVDGSRKLDPHPLLCGRSARHALQTLGTEWGRRLIGEDVWVLQLVAAVETARALDPDARIVVDDVRFPNETAAIRRLGGTLALVRRPEAEPAGAAWRIPLARRLPEGLAGLLGLPHPSEHGWWTLRGEADVTLPNGLGLAGLRRQVDALAYNRLGLRPPPLTLDAAAFLRGGRSADGP